MHIERRVCIFMCVCGVCIDYKQRRQKIDIYICIYVYEKNRAGTLKEKQTNNQESIAHIQKESERKKTKSRFFDVMRERTHIHTPLRTHINLDTSEQVHVLMPNLINL